MLRAVLLAGGRSTSPTSAIAVEDASRSGCLADAAELLARAHAAVRDASMRSR